jgi:hypothetical protein
MALNAGCDMVDREKRIFERTGLSYDPLYNLTRSEVGQYVDAGWDRRLGLTLGEAPVLA